MNFVLDIETNGFYHECTRIHCVGLKDLDTGEVLVYNDEGSAPPISQAITLLDDPVVRIVGHNVINFDIPVIQKFFPWFKPKVVQMIDTLVMGRIIHPDIQRIDLGKKWPLMPTNLYGKHSLEAYGYRLGCFKGDFCHQTDWKEWSQELQDYMVQDLNVTEKLWKHFLLYLTT
jgi:DNA polymerase III alpha subunit (gram-positive type)